MECRAEVRRSAAVKLAVSTSSVSVFYLFTDFTLPVGYKEGTGYSTVELQLVQEEQRSDCGMRARGEGTIKRRLEKTKEKQAIHSAMMSYKPVAMSVNESAC